MRSILAAFAVTFALVGGTAGVGVGDDFADSAARKRQHTYP